MSTPRYVPLLLLAIASCQTPSPIAIPQPTPDAGISTLARSDAAVSAPTVAAPDAGACGPTRVTQSGSIPARTSWAGEVLADHVAKRAWQGATLAQAAYAAPSSPAARTKWRAEPGPDNLGLTLFEPDGKKMKTPAKLRDAFGDRAIDESGRVFDLQKRAYEIDAPLTCHATELPSYSFSRTGRFEVCDAHGVGLAVRELRAGFVATLGDGELWWSPDDNYALAQPGPFVGAWGHRETSRKTLDKIVFDKSGKPVTTAIGGAADVFALSSAAYAVLSNGKLIVRRACDDAVIAELAIPPGPGAATLSFSDSGALLACARDKETLVYRIE